MSESPSTTRSAFIPLVILSATFLVFSIWQMTIIINSNTVLGKRIAELKEPVEKSEKLQDDLKRFYNDLLDLSARDTEVRNFVDRLGISRAK